MVAITIDARQMRRLERAVRKIEDGVPRALAPAINRALDRGRTTVKREIRKEYLIKAKDIPVRVRGASQARLSGEVRLDQGMLDLARFKVSPRGVQKRKHKRPIKAQVKVRSGGKLIAHGFVASMPTGFTGPFVRKGTARLPIKKLLAIGAPIMASQPTVGPAVNKAMGDSLAKNIDSQIVRLMAQAGGHS
jgi:hypothetical protein